MTSADIGQAKLVLH